MPWKVGHEAKVGDVEKGIERSRECRSGRIARSQIIPQFAVRKFGHDDNFWLRRWSGERWRDECGLDSETKCGRAGRSEKCFTIGRRGFSMRCRPRPAVNNFRWRKQLS